MFQKSDQNKFQFELKLISLVLKYNQFFKYVPYYVNKFFWTLISIVKISQYGLFIKILIEKKPLRGLKVKNMTKIDH